MRRVLTQMQAAEVRRLRAEKNDWDEPRYTGLEIAVAVGVSEATVWRVLSKQAAYAKMGKVEPGGISMEAASVALTLAPVKGLEAEAQASLARVRAMLAEGQVPPSALEETAPALGSSSAEEELRSGLAQLNARAREMGIDLDRLRNVPQGGLK